MDLTKRQAQVMNLLIMGLSAKQAAQTLKISKRTVAAHLSNARERMKAKTSIQAAVIFAMLRSG